MFEDKGAITNHFGASRHGKIKGLGQHGPAGDLPSVALWLTVAGQVRFSARMLGADLETGLDTSLGAG